MNRQKRFREIVHFREDEPGIESFEHTNIGRKSRDTFPLSSI